MSQIITLDDLTAYSTDTPIDPGLGQLVVDAINQYIENHTGRVWGETKQVTEWKSWSSNLWLRPDIVSVQSVKYGTPGSEQTTLDSSDYYFNSRGRITMPRPSRSVAAINDYIEVTYTAGATTVPDDLKLAALGIAQGFYQAAGNGQQDVSEVQVGSYRVRYANSSQSGSTGSIRTPSANNWAVIDSYRVRHV